MLRQSLITATVSALLCVSALGAAPKKVAKVDPGREAAEKVLREEVVGQVDRRENLAGALAEIPDSAAVRWQAGFVRDGKSWRAFDESPATGSDPAALAEYHSRRREAPQTKAGQIDLANWCKKHGLADQERAHVTSALALAPAGEQAEIRYRLGWQEIGGVWFSPDDLRAWQRLLSQTQASLKRWDSKLTHIAKGLSGSPRQREAALVALKQIQEPEAMPAIEIRLGGLSEEAALAAVGAMRRVEGPDTSLALARQAVFSPWPEVRTSAAATLKSRTKEDFVPSLISLLATPFKSELQVTSLLRTNGRAGQFAFVVSYILFRETGDQFQTVALRTTNYEMNEAIAGTIATQRSAEAGALLASRLGSLPSVQRSHNDVLRITADEAQVRERAVQEFNERTTELNERIGAVLATVSGSPPSSNPKDWWDWWRTESDTELAGGKETVVVSEDYVIGNSQSGFRTYECFVAGTPVWTDHGLAPIETISVGDRVLSQDVESGELTYKPVLHTTIRPPKELLSVRFEKESLVLTPGHRFWCSGNGWVKARDLEPASLVHTATGSTPVSTVKKGESAETYNLLVADFHTYFVGRTGVLCQDVLTPRGTDCLVPGLLRANAVAKKK